MVTTTYTENILSDSYINTAADGTTSTVPAVTEMTSDTKTRVYKNYFFGQEATAVSAMKQCTIVRGSDLVVESNRGYAIKNTQGDVNFLQSDLGGGACFPGGTPATFSYWGGNSLLNIDQNKMKTGELVLKSHVYKNFVKSIYDIAGSKELGSGSPLHIATPLDCLDNNMLLQPYVEEVDNDRG